MPVAVNDRLIIPDAELQWRFSPSGGPGGQHANKANTRAELSWNLAESAVLSTALSATQRSRLLAKLGEVAVVVVDEERSQSRNRDIAEQRLAARVRAALVVPKPRRKTKPSRGAKERRLKAKRSRSQDKQLRRRPGRDD